MRFSVYVFAWDIVWRGPEAVASELARAGIAECHVALVYHAVSAICPDAPAGVLFTRQEGRFYFAPRAETDFGEIAPHVDSLALSESQMNMWARVFSDRGIALVPWIVPTHDAVGAPAGLCQVGPLGDKLAHALCPAHPAVQDHVRAVIADLDARGLFPVIEVEHVGFGTFDHWRFAHHPKAGVPEMHPEVAELLSVCFCPACIAATQDAGVDARGLAAGLGSVLHEALAEGGPPGTIDAQREALDAHRAAGRQTVREHVAGLRAAASVPLCLSPLFPKPVSGFDPSRCLGDGDQLVVLGYAQSPDEIGQRLDALVAEGVAGSAMRVVVELGGRTDHQQVAAVLAERGVEDLCFYNYGLSSRKAREAWANQLPTIEAAVVT